MGRAFVFGDGIDTDALAPGRLMAQPLAELAKGCLASVDPQFAASVRPGDVVVARAYFLS
jgi:3-isopropylmalate/(R)-2-methylmalate dehydratase small subunit